MDPQGNSVACAGAFALPDPTLGYSLELLEKSVVIAGWSAECRDWEQDACQDCFQEHLEQCRWKRESGREWRRRARGCARYIMYCKSNPCMPSMQVLLRRIAWGRSQILFHHAISLAKLLWRGSSAHGDSTRSRPSFGSGDAHDKKLVVSTTGWSAALAAGLHIWASKRGGFLLISSCMVTD